MTIIGERLKEMRLERGMSQAEVAKLIGVERVTYLQYEKGKNKPVRKLKELATLFGVSIDYLLGNSENIPVDVTEKQKELVKGYDSLSTEGQKDLMSYLDYLKHKEKITSSAIPPTNGENALIEGNMTA